MYVISQKDINTMMTNAKEFREKISNKLIDDNVVDIENFNTIKSLTIFILEFLLPNMELGDIKYLQFTDKKIKVIIDRIIKKYYLKIEYCGMNNKTRIYKVYP